MTLRSGHPPVRLGVIGAKGVGHQGGIETYCRNFYGHLTPDRFEVTLFAPRSGAAERADGVKIVRIRAPKLSWLEMPLVALVAVVQAKLRGIRTLHVHGVGAAICLPLASLLGLRVVVRYLGPEYEAAQWGPIARRVLRACERFVGLFADQVVCLSEHLAAQFHRATGRTHGVHVIPNGVAEAPGQAIDPKIVDLLASGRPYVLAVGRIVKAKNFHLLAEAFLQSQLPPDALLVIAGETGFASSYRDVMDSACAESPRIRRVGAVFGADLWSLYRGCRIFVLPSMHEGMSFSLLEAGLAGAQIIASDIPQNAAVCRGFGRLVEVNSTAALRTALEEEWRAVRTPEMVERQIATFRSRHDWAEIARRMEPILVAEPTSRGRPRRDTGAVAQDRARDEELEMNGSG